MEGYRPDPKTPDFAYATDPWHQHGIEGEPPPQMAHGEVSPRWISLGLLAGFLLTGLLILATVWLFFVVKDQEKALTQEVDTGSDYVQIYAQSKRELESPAWADEAYTRARVPINVAMKDTVAWYAEVKAKGVPLSQPPASAPAAPQQKK